MRILIDIQTLYTHEKNRGIGIYTYYWLKNIIQHDDSHRYYLVRKKDNQWQFTFVTKYLDLDSRISKDQFWESLDLEEFISNNKIDIIHFTSPLMFDIDVPIIKNKKIKKSYLVYDLIPIIMKDHFYSKWPSHIQKDYNSRCELIKSADLILTISNATKKDLESLLNIDSLKINVIYASTNEVLYEPSRLGNERAIVESELGLTSPFIYSLTGYDPRKNNKGLITAFSEVSKLNPEIILVISGIKQENEKEEFILFAKQKGVKPDKIMFLGFISDDCLLALYKECEFFVFPSLYEGFGLPVLEAMRVRTAVITTNCSSLIEVAEEAAILVDPLDEIELANAMNTMLNDKNILNKFREAGLKQSKKFNWFNTTFSSLESLLGLSLFPEIASKTNKPLLAFLSPLNPQSSGISDYSEELLVYLKEHFEIKLFVNGTLPTTKFLNDNLEILDIKLNSVKLESIKLRIYHIGNNEIHDWIYDILKLYPGVVVLHDLNLYGFYIYTTFLRGHKEQFRNELNYCYGQEGLEASNNLILHNTYPESQQFPMFNKVVDLSTSVIVHSQWIKENINQTNNYTGEIQVIPQGVLLEESYQELSKFEIRNKLDMSSTKLIIGVFGNVIPNKRLEIILQSFAELLKTNQDTDLYIVGLAGNDIKQKLKVLIKQLGIEKSVKFESPQEIDLFKNFIKASDICINLRWPTMGETSATLTRALGYGVPCIVSNVGSYKEFPDDIVWKVDVDEFEGELLLAYLLELCNNHLLRQYMGNYACEYMKKTHDFREITKQYKRLILIKEWGLTNENLDYK